MIVTYFILNKKIETFYGKTNSNCINTEMISYPLINVNEDGVIINQQSINKDLKKELYKIKFYLNDILHKDIYESLYSNCYE